MTRFALENPEPADIFLLPVGRGQARDSNLARARRGVDHLAAAERYAHVAVEAKYIAALRV